MRRLAFFALALLLPVARAVPAQDLELPPLLGDHAVLQRGAPVRVWGKAAANVDVRVQSSWGHEASSRTDADGGFELRLQPADKPGPHELIVTSGSATRTVRDLWFGDVWVCGGQSNMEWTLGPGVGPGIADWQNEVRGADDPQLRVFDVPNVTSSVPLSTCAGEWKVCTPQTAGQFSAVGYLFARELRREVGVPIGLLVSCWGGTPAEAWTPEASVDALGEFGPGLAQVRAARTQPPETQLAQKQAKWFEGVASKDPGQRGGFAGAAFDDSAWPTMDLPGPWVGELAQWDGVVWYRRAVEVPAAWAGKALTLSLGPIDDLDTVWLDGERVGGTESGEPWSTPRRYTIPGERVRGGRAVLSLRVVDTGGGGGLHGAAEDLWLAPDAGERLRLAGPWRMQKGAALQALGAWPRQAGLGPNLPTTLWNGMIAPLARCGVRGAIFYQGESNAAAPLVYRKLFPAMIGAWRAFFGQPELPFYYVQIAPYAYGGASGARAAFLREAQTMAMDACQHVGMAVTMDIGDPRDIHPSNKQDVGKRLARWALAKTYGRGDVEFSGPMLAGHSVEGNAIRLLFRHASGLRSKDGEPLRHFTIAGADRVFHPAEAILEHGETVLVRSAAVAQPVAVRFGFGPADMTNLVNGAGLPAPSFRTDDWPPP